MDEKQKEYLKSISCTKEEYKQQIKKDLEKDEVWKVILYNIASIQEDKKVSNIDDLAFNITEVLWRLKNER